LGRDPNDAGRLASQPTIPRFEDTVAPLMLLAMRAVLTDTVIARHCWRRRGVRLMTIGLGITEDQIHGAQYLVAEILRPGNAAGTAGAVRLLKHALAFGRTSRTRQNTWGCAALCDYVDGRESTKH